MTNLAMIIQQRPSLLWLPTVSIYLLTIGSPDCPIGFYGDTYTTYYLQLFLDFCIKVFAGSIVALAGSLFFPRSKSFLERFAFLLPIAALLSVSLFSIL